MECEKTVSVLLDGQETTLTFVDLPLTVQKECVKYGEIEAYLITYSITSRESFLYAADILNELVTQGRMGDAAVIVVGNKNDLVRSRQVSEEEGRYMCQTAGCKYIEVSAALNHRVDDLLAGLVQQIRLNPTRTTVAGHGKVRQGDSTWLLTDRSNQDTEKRSSGMGGCFYGAKAFFADLLHMRRDGSRSCEDLWVL